MRQRRPAPRRRAIVAAVSLALVQAAGAQQRSVFEFGLWNGQLETGFEDDHENSHDGTSSSSSYWRGHESLTLRNSGFSLIDESIMTGSASLSFGRFQDAASSNGVHGSGQGSLTGYGLDTVFLGATPYMSTLHANRVMSFASQAFGRTTTTVEDQGAAFHLGETSALAGWGMPYFSSNLSVEREHDMQETTNVIGGNLELDQTRKRLIYDGHKGFLTSDLYVSYSLDDVHDANLPRDSSRTQLATANYSLDFGSSLNRRWDSTLSYLKRDGLFSYDTATVLEKLHIDHRSNLSSDYSYTALQVQAPSGTTTTQIGTAGLTHVLYRNLTSNGYLSYQHESLPAGTIDYDQAAVRVAYQRRLPADGTLTVNLSDNRQLHDNKLTSSRVNVIDESHPAPAPLGAGNGFTLTQPFVDTASIVVVDARGGARLPTVAGVDYDLLTIGGVTRIIPRITSVVIQPGDPLLISYTYQVDPSIKYLAAGSSGAVGLNYAWINVQASHDETSLRRISGQERGFLDEFRSDSATLDLRGAWRKVQLQGGAGYLHYESTLTTYIQRRLHQFALYRPASNTSISLNTNWTVTDFRLPASRSETLAVNLSLDRFSPGGWTTTALLSHRYDKESLVPTETVDEGSLTERWEYGMFSLLSTVAAARLSRGPYETTNWRFQINAIRAF
jgi:hypothetical protein